MPITFVNVAALLVALAPCAMGHGLLVEPPARNAVAGTRNGYCPHCGNGGGICGDGGQWPSTSNYLGGENAGPQRTYTAGDVVEFEVKITAHHTGHYELHVCEEHLGPLTPDPEGPTGCLSKWVLQRVAPEEVYDNCQVNDPRDDCQPLDTDHPERWYLSPGAGNKKMHFRLPQGLHCQSCTLQWRWWTANSCTPADGYACYFERMKALGWDASSWMSGWMSSWIMNSGGCGSSLLQSNMSQASSSRGCGEEFRNCADITVLASGAQPAPTQTPMPTSRSMTTTSPRSHPESEPEMIAEPEPEPETTPSTVDPRCETCTGCNPCIWTDGKCYSVSQAVCEGTSGAVFCGKAPTVAAAQFSSHESQATRRKGAVHSHKFLGKALVQARAALARAQKLVEEL